MTWLRRAWLAAIACGVLLAGGAALAMRYDLLDPAPTLSPDWYGHVLGLHGLLALAVLAAMLVVLPSFVVRPGRGSAVLGFLALGAWLVAVVLALRLDAQAWPPPSTRTLVLALAASVGLGAAQLVPAMPAARGSQLVAAVAALAALALVGTPLATGALPSATSWLLAITIAACGLVPDTAARRATRLALIAVAPCLVQAWVATIALHLAHAVYFDDTVAVVSPLPVTGAALAGALVVAATRARVPHPRLARAGAALMTTGACVTSAGFYILGSRGMPRRYLAYDPSFQSLQILVGAAALVTVLGALVVLEAFRRGSPAAR